MASVAVVSASAVQSDEQATANSNQIIVHYKSQSGQAPSIYYWNSLPQNIETTYPGETMNYDSSQEGQNWYTYTFNNLTKVNMIFVENGNQTKELSRTTSGEYWYHNNKWSTRNPDSVSSTERTDLREDTIYFIITTRFYDGSTGNNIHCWDDAKAGNPDSDTAWKGDFQGLIDKLDYIKALGFSAIWITPVVTNASGYDYHGYHALDFATVDARYESEGATYQDLIDAIHDKDMKVVQDVVWNHSGNFGESTLAPIFTKEFNNVKDLEDMESTIKPTSLLLDHFGLGSAEEYYAQKPEVQYQQRLTMMKEDNTDTQHFYHHEKSLGWGQYTEQTGQIAGDCVDINTENPEVAKYITDTYMSYVNMGVDSFRLDTEKHINRWTLNHGYFPVFSQVEDFYIFGEVCARWHGAFNEGGASDSPFFFTWKETGNWATNWSDSDWSSNYQNSTTHFSEHSYKETNIKSTNAFLNGNDYHTPDYSQANGTGVIDFGMHWAFDSASGAFNCGLGEDQYFNDSTWNVVYVDSHDYGPDQTQKTRYNYGPQVWAENLCLMYTFRGIPCLYYGSEVEFKKGAVIDVGPNAPLSETGRAYFGDYLEGSVTATDFSEYTASGKVAETLNNPLSKHIQQLSKIRRAIPALQKGQYSREGVSGDMSYKRRYTSAEEGVDSFVCVAVTGAASFSGIPNGKYVDAVTGDVQNVSNGSLSISAPGQGNMRVYVLSSNGFTGIDGKIAETGSYLK